VSIQVKEMAVSRAEEGPVVITVKSVVKRGAEKGGGIPLFRATTKYTVYDSGDIRIEVSLECLYNDSRRLQLPR